MTIEPRNDWILVEREEAQTKTASGIVLPNNTADRPFIATVLQVGPKVEDIWAGDKIVYKAYATTEVTIDKTEYLLVKEEDVLAKVKESKDAK